VQIKVKDTFCHDCSFYPSINCIPPQRDAYTKVTSTLYLTGTLTRPLHLIVGQTLKPAI
jgi:hypothetical protein